MKNERTAAGREKGMGAREGKQEMSQVKQGASWNSNCEAMGMPD